MVFRYLPCIYKYNIFVDYLLQLSHAIHKDWSQPSSVTLKSVGAQVSCIKWYSSVTLCFCGDAQLVGIGWTRLATLESISFVRSGLFFFHKHITCPPYAASRSFCFKNTFWYDDRCQTRHCDSHFEMHRTQVVLMLKNPPLSVQEMQGFYPWVGKTLGEGTATHSRQLRIQGQKPRQATVYVFVRYDWINDMLKFNYTSKKLIWKEIRIGPQRWKM